MSRVLVVGAGAAGLWGAALCARAGHETVVFEKTPRTGTKVLASGGTQCNLTTTLDASQAARWFRPAGERFLRYAFSVLRPEDVRERFHELGVPTEEAPLEKIFPTSRRAKDVRDALERDAREAGAEIRLEQPVTGLRREDSWVLELAAGEERGDLVLLATGGSSFASTGTIGEGYRWLEALDLPVTERAPALAPLTSKEPWVHELSGIALPDAVVRVVDPSGKVLAERARPLLFTHRGLSGPAAMDLSVHVTRGDGCALLVELLPEDREALRERLIEFARRSGRPRLARALPEIPRRVLAAATQQAGLEANPVVCDLGKAQRHGLVEALKGLRIEVDGSEGFDKAEVTTGGLELKAVNPRSMEVNRAPGLYVVGELLDLDGPIGGFSFLAAFATAEVAGRAIAELA